MASPYPTSVELAAEAGRTASIVHLACAAEAQPSTDGASVGAGDFAAASEASLAQASL